MEKEKFEIDLSAINEKERDVVEREFRKNLELTKSDVEVKREGEKLIISGAKKEIAAVRRSMMIAFSKPEKPENN